MKLSNRRGKKTTLYYESIYRIIFRVSNFPRTTLPPLPPPPLFFVDSCLLIVSPLPWRGRESDGIKRRFARATKTNFERPKVARVWHPSRRRRREESASIRTQNGFGGRRLVVAPRRYGYRVDECATFQTQFPKILLGRGGGGRLREDA